MTMLICSTTFCQAQKDYDFSAGVRIGLALDAGVSVKGFVSESVALEGILMTPLRRLPADPWLSRITVVALGEWHYSGSKLPALNFVVGGGWCANIRTREPTQQLMTGPSALLGMEYTLPHMPLAIQLDALPIYFLGLGLNMDLSLCMRYTF